MKYKKFIALLIVILLMATIIAGCGTPNSSNDTGTTTNGETASPGPEKSEEAPDASQATEEPAHLTYYWNLPTDKVTPIYSDMAESPLYKAIMEKTNIDIEFIHPPADQNQEKFTLMVTSGTLTDIFEYGLSSYPGGVAKAISDGLVTTLNDHLDKMPGLSKVFAEHPEWEAQSKDDDGNLYAVPFIRTTDELRTWAGPLARYDWLLKMGYTLETLPRTIDEWTTMLTKMKAEFDVEYPLIVLSIGDFGSQNVLPGAFDVGWEYYVDRNGELQYGPLQPGFRDFIAQMNAWYEAGLINPDFPSKIDQQKFRSEFSTGDAGVINATTVGGSMGYFYDTLKPEDNNYRDYRLIGLPYPTVTGEKSRFGNRDLAVHDLSASISGDVTDLDAALRLLDFGYTEEGHSLFNNGIEGLNFDYVNYKEYKTTMDISKYGDKFPLYNEKITADPNYAMPIAMSQFIRAHYGGPFLQELSYFVQFTYREDQQQTIMNWLNSSDFSALEPRIYRTEAEAEETANLDVDLKTYRDTELIKFITGERSMDEWDGFVAQLKKLGADRLLEIRRAGYQRALKR